MDHEPLVWLRPAIPLWGCSTRLVSLVEGLTKNLAPAGRQDPLASVLIAHDDKDSKWRFGEVFDVVTTLRGRRIPKNFEMLLVPGRLFAALVHVPLNGGEGYPAPLGILSFDPELLRGAHDVMSDIVAAGLPAVVSGERDGDVVQDLLDALRLPANFPGGELPKEPPPLVS